MRNQPIADGGTDGGRSPPSPHLTYEIDDEPPSEAVVGAVAALTDVAVLDLDPLYDVVDPEQLDWILGDVPDDSEIEISFEFGGCAVTVLREEVRVRTIEGDSD